MSRATVVVNPAALGGAAALAEQVAARLAASFATVEVLQTSAAGDGAVLARQSVASASLVVAVGGDGTAREVADGVAVALGTWGTGGPAAAGAPALLLVPGGTGNSMHQALWGDMAWEQALDMVERGEVDRRDVDLLRISGRGDAVLLGASAGFLRWTVEATARFPDLSGRALYERAALAAVAELRPFPGAVRVDGTLLCEGDIALAAVGGARRRGGSLAILPRSELDDGLLDVCVLEARDGEAATAQLLAALSGAHLGLPGVHYAQGRAVTLECREGALTFEHDGDLWAGDDSTLTLQVVPAAVPMLVPRR